MIRLIASDLDGTLLLNDSQELLPGTIDLIRELRRQDRIFVPASGRQHSNLNSRAKIPFALADGMDSTKKLLAS